MISLLTKLIPTVQRGCLIPNGISLTHSPISHKPALTIKVPLPFVYKDIDWSWYVDKDDCDENKVWGQVYFFLRLSRNAAEYRLIWIPFFDQPTLF